MDSETQVRVPALNEHLRQRVNEKEYGLMKECVLNTLTLFRNAQPEISRASLERRIHDALAGRRLIKVVRSLYINRMTTTPGEIEEAAV